MTTIERITSTDKHGKPFTTFATEGYALAIAAMNNKRDPEWTYEVVMGPDGRYSIAVIDEAQEFLGFL